MWRNLFKKIFFLNFCPSFNYYIMLNVFTALGGLYSVIVDETCFLVQWTYFAFPSFSVLSIPFQ